MNIKLLNKIASKVFILLVIEVVCACGHESSYPQELTMADSAFMQGNYELGDALLETAKKQIVTYDSENKNYYQLLKIEQKYVSGNISDLDFSLADSLYRYYTSNNQSEKIAKTLFLIGAIHAKIKNYPTAISYYLKALKTANNCLDSRLVCLIYRRIGNLYFDERILNECVPYYRKYYQLANTLKDTLQMAYGASFMGDVCIINQQVDSVIYFYNKSMELGKGLQQEKDIVPIVKSKLCDIYIQLEEYDKALEIMPRDSLNEANWAYWHYGQNHVDSAIYYFQKTLGRYKWQGEVEVLRVLAQLEEQRGNVKAALNYHTRLAEAEDSLKTQQQKEETLRIEAQHNYNSMQQERNQLEQKNKELNLLLWLMGIIVVAISIVAVLLWRARKQRKRTVVMQQHLIEKEKTEQQLLGQLQSAHKEASLLEFKKTALYQRLKAPAKEGTKKMTEAEWHQLANSIDGIYNNFTSRLMNLAKLSETELRICYLLKINMPPSEIADILYKSKGAITLARRRMYRKLTGNNGTAEELDSLIAEL
jgi:DNA-binding CsgD family transcriptional regulator